MAIDLPPGFPPELATVQEMHAYVQSSSTDSEAAISTQVAGYDVIVYGNTDLSTQRVKEILEGSTSLNDAISKLQFAYFETGDRLTRLRYLLKSNQLIILVINGYISDVEGPKSLTGFFWDVEGQSFELPSLESSRILANLQANREGQLANAQYALVHPESEQVRLIIETEKNPEHKPVKFNAELGNPGNRFVGRHFLFANAQLDTQAAQLKLSLTKSINSLDDDDRNGSLEGYQLAGNSILPIGLVGYGVSRTEYNFMDSSGNEFDSEITQAQVLLQEIFHADQVSRSLATQRILFVSSSRDTTTSQSVLDERYFAAEAGFEHTRFFQIWNLRPRLKVTSSLRKGLSDNSGTFGDQQNGVDRDARFLIFSPDLSFKFAFMNGWSTNLRASSQFADRQVPEQQQWYLGGAERLRAWLPGSLLGDNGHYLGLDIHTPEFYLWNTVKIKPGLFIEAGSSRFKMNNSQFSSTQKAIDAGVMIDLEFAQNWQLNLTAAEPLSEDVTSTELLEDNEAEFYFSLKASW